MRRRPGRTLAANIAAAIAIVLVLAGVGVAVAWVGGIVSRDTGDPVAHPTVPPLPTVPPTPAPTADPALEVLPDSCTALFSSGMRGTLRKQGLVLADRVGPVELRDGALAGLASTLPALRCQWVREKGGALVIDTVVAVVDRERAAEVRARIRELGYDALREPDGTRYVWRAKLDGVDTGESHLLLQGVWFATHWVGYGPYGYTADMVDRVHG